MHVVRAELPFAPARHIAGPESENTTRDLELAQNDQQLSSPIRRRLETAPHHSPSCNYAGHPTLPQPHSSTRAVQNVVSPCRINDPRRLGRWDKNRLQYQISNQTIALNPVISYSSITTRDFLSPQLIPFKRTWHFKSCLSVNLGST